MSARKSNRIIRHPERGNIGLKLVDRYLGIPLVRLLGLLRKKSGRTISPVARRAAFLQTAAIGDTVLLSAIVKDFNKAFPGCFILIFTGSSNYETACLIPGVNEVVKLAIKNPLRALKRIRQAGFFDVWFDCGPWPRLNAVMTYYAHAALKIGFETSNQYRHYVYDRAERHSSQTHELDNYRNLLRACGIKDCSNLPGLNAAGSKKIPRRIAIHMFAGGARAYLKEWPDDRWVALIDRLVESGYSVCLTGAPVDRERALTIQERVNNRDNVAVVAGTHNLRETAELLGSSELVISVDTGIMHIASAMGCRLISLHGPTSPKRWGPLNAEAIALSATSACSPCISLGFESTCKDPKCMRETSIEDVYSTVIQQLSRR
jgi:ADP-heptose:LPS heptosyltransferase